MFGNQETVEFHTTIMSYVKQLKQRIVILEAGKCERCLLGGVEDCDRCGNEIYQMLFPKMPIDRKFNEVYDMIKEQYKQRIGKVKLFRDDINWKEMEKLIMHILASEEILNEVANQMEDDD